VSRSSLYKTFTVRVDRLEADPKLVSDCIVGTAFGDQLHHLSLSVGERGDPLVWLATDCKCKMRFVACGRLYSADKVGLPVRPRARSLRTGLTNGTHPILHCRAKITDSPSKAPVKLFEPNQHHPRAAASMTAPPHLVLSGWF
jgi:hypothetical protein